MIIRCLRKTGLSIQDVRHFIDLFRQGNKTLLQRRDILQKQKKILEEKIRELEIGREFIDLKLEHYEHMLAGKGKEDENYRRCFMELFEKMLAKTDHERC